MGAAGPTHGRWQRNHGSHGGTWRDGGDRRGDDGRNGCRNHGRHGRFGLAGRDHGSHGCIRRHGYRGRDRRGDDGRNRRRNHRSHGRFGIAWGTTGATGVSGAAGTTGATGVGTAGTTGATGAAGTPGVFATIGVAITGSQTFGNSNTTIGTTTYTASAGEFALVFVSEQLTVTSSTASGFNMAVTCTGVGAQPIDQPGPFADGTGAIVPFVGKFGPLSAGSVTINVEVSTNTSGATGETISGSMLILRSTN